jgi:hypothetical protein
LNRSRATLVALLALSGPRTAWSETCAPRVDLAGDAALSSRIAEQLRALGDPTDRDPSSSPVCRDVHVDVAAAVDGAIAVTLHDPGNRVETRIVSNAMIASAWIDSWARDELVVATVPVQTADVEAPVAAREPELHASVTASHSSWAIERVVWSGAYEHAWGTDGTHWDGGTLAACVRVGAFCLGGRARAAFEPNLAAEVTSASRYDLSALAIGRWLTSVGKVAIAPEVGVGVGRFSTSRVETCVPNPPQCNPANGNCPMPQPCDATHVFVGDQLTAATVTPRLEAAIGISIPIASAVWLDGSASVTAAPGAHTGAFNSMMPPPGTTPAQVALPGEPLAAVQLAIGLRVGIQ